MLQACLQLHPLDRPLRVGIHKRLLVTARLRQHPGMRSSVCDTRQILDAMLRKSHFQDGLVNGDGVGDMTLANDAATGSAQGEMNLPSLLRVCVADLPMLVFGKDQIQPRVFHYKHHLRGAPQGTSLSSQSLFPSSNIVAAIAEDSSGAAVATSTIYLPDQV